LAYDFKCNNKLFLFLGIFKFSQAMNKASLSDIVIPAERANVFGKFNAAASVGFVFGPTIAGWLMMTEGGFQLVAYSSALIFLFNALLNYFIISRFIPIDEVQHRRNANRNGISLFSALNIFRDIHKVPWHLVWDAFMSRFLMSLSLIVYRSNFTSILSYKFETSPLTNGYIQSFNGFVSMATGWSLGIIRPMFPSNAAMSNSFSVLLVVSLLVLTLSPSLVVYVLCIIPLCISSSVLRVSNSTAIANRGGEETRGLVLGLANTLTSLGRAVGPAIAGYALEMSYTAPGLCAALFAVFGTLIGFYASRKNVAHLHVD